MSGLSFEVEVLKSGWNVDCVCPICGSDTCGARLSMFVPNKVGNVSDGLNSIAELNKVVLLALEGKKTFAKIMGIHS